MELVEVLGSRGDPWKIRAVLDTNAATYPTATLIGETTCGFVDGVCTFETLGISHQGSGYVISKLLASVYQCLLVSASIC